MNKHIQISPLPHLTQFLVCLFINNKFFSQVIMKTVKDHVLELSKHEHGHCTIITLLDAVDDTVLVNKIIIGEILKFTKELASDEWGRKVCNTIFVRFNINHNSIYYF